jgi:hypothetical protein
MTRIGIAVLAAAAIAIACGKRKPAPSGDAAAVIAIDAPAAPELVVIRRVDVDVVAPSGEDRPSRDQLAAVLGALGSGTIAESAPLPAGVVARQGTLRATVTWDLGGTTPAPTVLMTIEATIELSGGVLGVAARAAGEAAIEKKAAKGEVADRLAAKLAEQVAGELKTKLQLRAGPTSELVNAATTAETEVAAWALELAAERRDPQLRAAAVAGLRANPRLRAAAIQYLVALGDPANVKPIADAADFASPDELATIIEAVTALGGDEARAFLEMMAAGASDRDLGQRAKDGLERIDRREDASPR